MIPVDFADIPWEQLAFPTAVWALAHFHDSRGKTECATCLNPTGDTSPACGRRASNFMVQ